MECACEIEVDTYGGEFCDFHHKKRLKSFKEHQCDECGDTIGTGTEYELVRGRFEGEWFTNKTCPLCLELRERLFNGGFYYRMIRDSITQNIYEMGGISETCIAELSPSARSVLCDMVEEALEWDDPDAIDDHNEMLDS